jgi:peptide/nickel transport system substrate-binding protein
MKKVVVALLLVLSMTLMGTGNAQKLEPIPEINFVTWSPEGYYNRYEISTLIAEEWKKLGLRVKLNPMVYPNPMVTVWFQEHKFDVIYANYTSLPFRMEPDFFTNAKFNSVFSGPGDWNVGEWKNPEFDKIGDEQLKVYDPEKRKKLIHKLQEMIYNDIPEAVVISPVIIYGINNSKFDVEYATDVNGPISLFNRPKFYPKGNDKVLKVGHYFDLQTWNPLAAKQSGDFMQLFLIYDCLVQAGPDGSVRMWAAKSVKPVGSTTIEVVLRDGMKFHDGKPVTVEDVKFSYEYMKKWEAPYFIKYLEPIKNIEIVSNNTLHFHLNRPYAPFIMNTLGQVFIIPKHIWKDIPEKMGLSKPQDFRNVPPVGSGMYKVEYYRESQEFLYRRHTDHFSTPKVDVLNIVFGSAELVMSALKKGTIDMAQQEITPAVARELQKEKNIRLFRTQQVGYSGLVFHAARPPFNDKKMREALAFAIPYKKLIDEVLLGDGVRSASTIVPANAFWHNKSLNPREYDLERARKILKDAGYRWDGQGRLCYPGK